MKFNNEVILYISKNHEYKYSFKNFLKYHAHDWIERSNIMDKQTHFEAINVYLNIIDRPSEHTSLKETSPFISNEVYDSDNEDE